MTKKRRVGKGILTIIGTLVLPSIAVACTYGPPYATVCAKYSRSDAVLIATIDRVVSNENQAEQKVNLKIERVFKGNVPSRLELDQPLSTCDWDFTNYAGAKMLLYLKKNDKSKQYHAIGTGYGGPIEKVAADLYWLEDVKKSLKRTHISGRLGLYRLDYHLTLEQYLSDIPITVTDGKRSYTTRTDEKGIYQFWDIPFGLYRIIPSFKDIEDEYHLYFTVEKGDISWNMISENEYDDENFQVRIGSASKCGGANYVFKRRTESDQR